MTPVKQWTSKSHPAVHHFITCELHMRHVPTTRLARDACALLNIALQILGLSLVLLDRRGMVSRGQWIGNDFVPRLYVARRLCILEWRIFQYPCLFLMKETMMCLRTTSRARLPKRERNKPIIDFH